MKKTELNIRRRFEKHPVVWTFFYFFWVVALFIVLGGIYPQSLIFNVVLRIVLGAGILYHLYRVFHWTPKALGFSKTGLLTSLRLYWLDWVKIAMVLCIIFAALHPNGVLAGRIGTPRATLVKIARNIRRTSPAKGFRICLFGLSVGFFEEVFIRVGMVNQLRLAFPDSPRSAWAISLISGAFFASLHWINLGAQSLSLTAMQVIQAFGIGVLWAAIYWRSGNILVPIVMHSLTDILVLFQTAGTSPAVSANYLSSLVVLAACLLLTAVYLRPKKAVSSGIQTSPLCYNKKINDELKF
ncbi:CPBP family intramembrane glutamic endopeptidase [Pseudoramibacter sp.]|jgi:membrane protease YdiL (CAAX protease family)|uniref:CPBP family intramembrane glutamic endopeptidase n=1 Tax=Pseudoramibacter sp. TaxID=2034862 RepID=UPI0025F1A532|nr:type II CAAX endopeptidase family protein [Pseudoramibacter sp.]MCH4072257.1 CPBP family intramembrane metalloprotease [Pseudoramibacter sp.]MCH4106027.1 CPBP family intramembrane metalloprotease [Pseudoramibacter sp.]